MNVSGVPSAPVAPPVPAVTRPEATSQAATRTQKQPSEAAAQAAAQQAAIAAAAAERKAAEKLPPLKPLSTTEVRVILGALPPSQATARRGSGGAASSFDAYA